VSAFVSPNRVPQMADAAEVFAGIERRPGVRYSALVPNLAGLERALGAGSDEIAIFTASTETFSRKNINRSIAESLDVYRTVCERANAAGLRVRGYLSTAFGCPYEGRVDPDTVAVLASRLLDLGVYEVAISDTIGVAHPGQVAQVLDTVLGRLPAAAVALHCHDTRGTALANVLTALTFGIATFDASCGGLGGCPFARSATGNLASEDLIYMLDGLDIQTGVSLPGVLDASTFIAQRVGHPLPSRYAQAVLGKAAQPAESAGSEAQADETGG
jgi:hydroxymethylglutaryl-CoA lyase